MKNAKTATLTNVYDYLHDTPWELKSQTEIDRLRTAAQVYEKKYAFLLPMARKALMLQWLKDEPYADDLGKRMMDNYFAAPGQQKKPFVLTLADMKFIAANRPNKNGTQTDFNHTLSLTEAPGWNEACEEALSTGKPQTFNGTFVAQWNDGALGSFTVHFEGTITPQNAKLAVWEGTIWFTRLFTFAPNWDYPSNKHRSHAGEQRTRIAYILSLGTDYEVTSVHATAVQGNYSTRLRITGLAPGQ
jgi:hypothetical protein